jgi:hypothetical protein
MYDLKYKLSIIHYRDSVVYTVSFRSGEKTLALVAPFADAYVLGYIV